MKSGEIVAEKYRLNARLGIGGMGQVWSVTHTQTDREFAIKVMHPHIAESQEARTRFTREAKASARINHPNVIDIFDVGEMSGGSLFLVMELLDGLPLADAFFAQPSLSVRDFLSIMLDTAHALEAAHKADIVHRDVKPANIYLHRERLSGLACAKIVDFGISKFSGANDSVATSTGSVLGSPRYMSPEQTRSAASTDARSDIWALGVVLFEGLVGFWPHDGDSYSSLVVAIVTTPPKSIDEHGAHLPSPLRELINGCLQPRETRIQTAAEVATRIAQIIEDGDLASLSLPEPKTKAGGITTTGQISVKTPPPRKGLGASSTDDEEKTQTHQVLPASVVSEGTSDEEDMPTGRVDLAQELANRASSPEFANAVASFPNLPNAAPAPPQALGTPAQAWQPARPPAPSQPELPPARSPHQSSPGFGEAAPVPSLAQSGPTPIAAPSVAAAAEAQRPGHGTVKLHAVTPAPLTETESKMNMAASQAPPSPIAARFQGAKKMARAPMGLAAIVMAVLGVGVGWLVVSVAGGDDESVQTEESEHAASEPDERPLDHPPENHPPEKGDEGQPTSATAPQTSEPDPPPPVPPTAASSAAVEPDAAPSVETSASAPKPTKPSPRGPTRPPPPPSGIDDLGSGL